jgi:hypothetical protein
VEAALASEDSPQWMSRNSEKSLAKGGVPVGVILRTIPNEPVKQERKEVVANRLVL